VEWGTCVLVIFSNIRETTLKGALVCRENITIEKTIVRNIEDSALNAENISQNSKRIFSWRHAHQVLPRMRCDQGSNAKM
jgi:hypothetical protein